MALSHHPKITAALSSSIKRKKASTMTLASHAFKTEFAVDMTCQNCVNSVTGALRSVTGVDRYDIDLENKRVTIEGRAPPSVLLSALKSTKRQVVVRGAGPAVGEPGAGMSSAAIAIFESPIPSTTSKINANEFTQQVFGLSRFIQIAPKLSLLDLTLKIPPSPDSANAQYEIYVGSTGDVSNPPETTGPPLLPLGKVSIDSEGYGDLFKELPGEVWEWIGRACVAKRVGQEHEGGIYAGVIARSSGAWGNEKTVCACSGRTMWEEGREWAEKGV